MAEDQFHFEDELDKMVSDGFSIASVNLKIAITFAVTVIIDFFN